MAGDDGKGDVALMKEPALVEGEALAMIRLCGLV
jgi:hypothetical protein